MDYIKYHMDSAAIGDIDPANACLAYVADRFELNMEQRYWLAFLYSTCYCGATVYYMYQEFPDFENVDVGRLQRWWKANKDKCVFQTDRLRIKTTNQFVPSFESYKQFIGSKTQQQKFREFRTPMASQNYHNAYRGVQEIRNVGRFTTFIYLEMLDVLTDYKCEPITIDWEKADNCRKGLCKAADLPDTQTNARLDSLLWDIGKVLGVKKCSMRSVYNIETTLCAFEKHTKGQRHVGYYIERQLAEIDKMAANVKTGVCWDVLYQFRKETYKHVER